MSALAKVTPIRQSAESVWLSPEQVCDRVPGLSVANLKAMRAAGTGPAHSKPTGKYGRVIVYALADVDRWVREARITTREQS